MGNNSSNSNRGIRLQEAYVEREITSINKSNNYVSSNRYNNNGFEQKYTRNQIEAKLRQDYSGRNTYKNRNDYVLSSDWERMKQNNSVNTYK